MERHNIFIAVHLIIVLCYSSYITACGIVRPSWNVNRWKNIESCILACVPELKIPKLIRTDRQIFRCNAAWSREKSEGSKQGWLSSEKIPRQTSKAHF